jgi:hypothetical protein
MQLTVYKKEAEGVVGRGVGLLKPKARKEQGEEIGFHSNQLVALVSSQLRRYTAANDGNDSKWAY